MKKTRYILGAVLILISIAGTIFWEMKGREMWLTEEVLVSAQELKTDTIIEQSMVKSVPVLKENVVQGALHPSDINRISKRHTARFIPRNQQLRLEDFEQNKDSTKEGRRIFPLKTEWIECRSSSLRKNDWIAVYGAETGEYLGTYQLAFVKDQEEVEVRDDETSGDGGVLSRTGSTSPISHVEILADISEYQKLRAAVGVQPGDDQVLQQLILMGVSSQEEMK